MTTEGSFVQPAIPHFDAHYDMGAYEWKVSSNPRNFGSWWNLTMFSQKAEQCKQMHNQKRMKRWSSRISKQKATSFRRLIEPCLIPSIRRILLRKYGILWRIFLKEMQGLKGIIFNLSAKILKLFKWGMVKE